MKRETEEQVCERREDASDPDHLRPHTPQRVTPSSAVDVYYLCFLFTEDVSLFHLLLARSLPVFTERNII